MTALAWALRLLLLANQLERQGWPRRAASFRRAAHALLAVRE